MSICVNDTDGDGNCPACARNPKAPCRVSARDEIAHYVGEHGGVQRSILDGLLDAYAHELAEKIRNSERLRDYTDDHMGDMNEAADEIDPEVG